MAVVALLLVAVLLDGGILLGLGDNNKDLGKMQALAATVRLERHWTLLPKQSGNDRKRAVAARIRALRLVNYYPADAGWTNMWTHWRPAVLRHDFGIIRKLGGNAVRLIVFPSTFGWPNLSARMAMRFSTAVSIAAAQGLGVQVTLFDWWDAYRDINMSRVWLRSLLHPFKNDAAIRLVELKNEVNPADTAEVSWVRALLPTLRAVLPRTPSTVSVSGPVGPPGFVQLRKELHGIPLDVADIHFYGSAGSAYGWMLAAKRAAGPLPLFVGETGYPVINDGGGAAAAEAQQAHWYSVVFAAARAAGVPDPAPWTLYDFRPDAVPPLARGPDQDSFGLYSSSGRKRWSAWVVEQAFRGRMVNTSNLGFNLAGENNQPMVWLPYLKAQGILAYAPGVGHDKRGSVSLAHTSASPLGAPGYFLVPTSPPVSRSQWTVSAWAKGVDVTGTAQIAMAWFRSNGTYLGESSSRPLPQGSPGWTKLTVRARVPHGATSVSIFLKSYDTVGKVWFDDVGIAVKDN